MNGPSLLQRSLLSCVFASESKKLIDAVTRAVQRGDVGNCQTGLFDWWLGVSLNTTVKATCFSYGVVLMRSGFIFAQLAIGVWAN